MWRASLAVALLIAVGTIFAAVAVAAGATDASLIAENQSINASQNTTVEIRIENANNGVGAYDVLVSVDDLGVAEVVGASTSGGAEFNSTSISDDGSSVEIVATGTDTADNGSVTIATVTIQGVGAGSTSVSLNITDVSDEAGVSYDVQNVDGVTVSVNGSPTATPTPTPTPTPTSAPAFGGGGGSGGSSEARFESDATLNSQVLAPSDQLRVNVTARNVGDREGEFETNLFVGGEVRDTAAAEIGVALSRELTLRYTIPESGVYDVRVDETLLGTVVALRGEADVLVKSGINGGTATFTEGPVDEVTFERAVSGDVAIARLASLPTGTRDPPGILLLPLEVVVPSTAEDTSATVNFSVSQDRLTDSKTTPDEVRLFRYDSATGEWTREKVRVVGEEDSRVRFMGNVSGFSLFAIVGQAQQSPSPTQTDTSTNTATPEQTPTTRSTTEAPLQTEPGRFGPGLVIGLIVLIVVAVAAIFIRRRGR